MSRIFIFLIFASPFTVFGQGSLDVKSQDVRDPRGCLNLQRVLDKISSFPDSTQLRQVTTDVIVSTKAGPSGRVASESLIRLFSGANYNFFEKRLNEYRTTRPKISQTGCRSVLIDEGAKGSIEMQVKKAGKSRLTLKSPTEIRVVELRGPREILVRSSFLALDYCSEGDKYGVQKTTLMTWGTDSDLQSRQERLQKTFLAQMAEAFLNFPQELRDRLNQAKARKKNLDVNVAQLKELTTLELDPRLKKCPDPTPTPTPPDEVAR